MTRKEAKKAIEVMQAYADGKEIEMRDRILQNGEFNLGEWRPFVDSGFFFGSGDFDYRVKPEHVCSQCHHSNDDNNYCHRHSYLISGDSAACASFELKKKRVPWTAETCPLKCGDVVTCIADKSEWLVCGKSKKHDEIAIGSCDWMTLKELCKKYTYNGKPCGEEIEE